MSQNHKIMSDNLRISDIINCLRGLKQKRGLFYIKRPEETMKSNKGREGKSRKFPQTKVFDFFLWFFYICALIGGFFLFIYGLYNVVISYHNIDLSYNMALITNDLNNAGLRLINGSYVNLDYREFYDKTISGNIVNLSETYGPDWRHLKSGVKIMILASLSLGVSFVMVLMLSINIGKEYGQKKRT